MRMLGNVAASTALCVRTSQLQDAGRLRDEHASLAKAFTTARMRETVGWAREVLGGNGILLEHHVGRFVADAEAIYSYEGTREINTLIVGRAHHRGERVRVNVRDSFRPTSAHTTAPTTSHGSTNVSTGGGHGSPRRTSNSSRARPPTPRTTSTITPAVTSTASQPPITSLGGRVATASATVKATIASASTAAL